MATHLSYRQPVALDPRWCQNFGRNENRANGLEKAFVFQSPGKYQCRLTQIRLTNTGALLAIER
jgi:hypothetical protein